MKSVTQSRRAGAASPALIILILVLGAVGSVGTFWWLGNIDIPMIDSLRDGTSAVDRSGKMAVPIAARNVSAYTKVRRDDLWSPETQEFASVWLDEEVVEERGIMTAKEVLNRVLAIDKAKGYAFYEDDFLPKGTREGPSAGIEPGMRGLRVDAHAIRGLHGLRRGDRFDLIATQSMESNGKASRRDEVSPLARAAQKEDEAWEVSTRIIVQNGKLVEPVGARASIAPNGTQRRQVEEAFLGISEDEITRLTEALAVEAEILCVPRSALPGAGGMDLMAHTRPDGPGVVEVYSNGKRSLTYVPRGPSYEDEYAEYEDFEDVEELVEETEEAAPEAVVVEAVAPEAVEEPELEATLVDAESPEAVPDAAPEVAALAELEPIDGDFEFAEASLHVTEADAWEQVDLVEATYAAGLSASSEPVELPDYSQNSAHDDLFVEDCSEDLELAALVEDPEPRDRFSFSAEDLAPASADPLPKEEELAVLENLSVMDAIVANEMGVEEFLDEEDVELVEPTEKDVSGSHLEEAAVATPTLAAAEASAPVVEEPLATPAGESTTAAFLTSESTPRVSELEPDTAALTTPAETTPEPAPEPQFEVETLPNDALEPESLPEPEANAEAPDSDEPELANAEPAPRSPEPEAPQAEPITGEPEPSPETNPITDEIKEESPVLEANPEAIESDAIESSSIELPAAPGETETPDPEVNASADGSSVDPEKPEPVEDPNPDVDNGKLEGSD